MPPVRQSTASSRAARRRPVQRLGLGLLQLLCFSPTLLPPAQAGPLLRRAQERRACQEFAGRLQAASGNPQQAQQVYQQGVLALVQQFGDNPCTAIPAPVATPTATSPATAPAPGPAAATPAATTPAAAAPAAATPAAAPANPQQTQACQEFASKLQAARGNPAQAQQIYAMGTQKLSGMFGPNPCPQVSAP
jgi:hypothetical protein